MYSLILNFEMSTAVAKWFAAAHWQEPLVALAAFPPFRQFELRLIASWFNIKLPITMGVERQSVRRGGGLRRHSVLAWLRMWRVGQKGGRGAAEDLQGFRFDQPPVCVLGG